VQGQGIGTARKQELFYHANAVGMRIVVSKAQLSRFPFWLFDGNCGSGWNDEVGVIGSPINAHKVADWVGLAASRRQFYFCDRNRASMVALQDRLAADPAWEACSHLLNGDNEEGLALFGQRIADREKPEFAVGAVIVDPNGWFYRDRKGEGPPIDGLQAFAQQFKRIDIILNLNVRTYVLQKGQAQKGHGPGVMRPTEVLRCLHRNNWLVGRIKVGQSRFWVAVGRNVATGDHRKVGLYHIDSKEGREVMLFAESGRQGGLFDAPDIAALPNLQRVSQAPGLPLSPSAGNASGERTVPMRRPGD